MILRTWKGRTIASRRLERAQRRILRKTIMRVVGCLNLLFFPLGIAYFSWSLHSHPWHGLASTLEWAMFLGIATTGLLYIAYSAYLGIRFVQLDETAILPAAFTFLFSLIFLFLVGLSWSLVPAGDPHSQSIVVSFWGLAEGFMIPQLATYYPAIGLFVVLILWLLGKRSRSALVKT